MAEEKSPIVRCQACGVIYPNTPTDKGYHRANCVYDLRLRVQALEDENGRLKGAVENAEKSSPYLGDNIPFDTDEDETADEPDLDSEDGPAAEPVQPSASDGWDDDEDSLASRPTGPIHASGLPFA